MKREIKFRGLRVDGEGWVYGSHGILGDDTDLEKHVIMVSTLDSNSQIDRFYFTDIEVIPETVGQFTGIKDKNGLKIYEGDLLSDPYPIDEEDLSKGYHESLLPVIWCNVKLQWCVDTSFSKDGSFLFSLVEYFGNNLEVKGNVYEKELEVKL